ncbi:MAG: amidohydrolase family protein [Halobacteriales archaeon]
MGTPDHDLLVTNGYHSARDDVVDIAISNGTITAIESSVDGVADRTLDADGRLVSPGLIDAHVHYDQAFSADSNSERRPRYHDQSFEKDQSIQWSAENVAETPRAELTDRAIRAARMAASNGVLHARAHCYLDGESGAKAVKAVIDARDRVADLIDLQLVAFPQRGFLADPGSQEAAHEALKAGADLVGGLDPASINDAIGKTIDVWFDIAEAHDVDIDAHLHDAGSIGLHTLDRLARATVDRGFEGRVTASHSYALADTDRSDRDPLTRAGGLEAAIERFQAADLRFVTCYQSTPPMMPLERLIEADLVVGHGTDQVRDMWGFHGNADVLQGALVESLKLAQSTYGTNEGLRLLWQLLTHGSAEVLGLEGYGLEIGTPADIVILDARSPEWAITTQPSVRTVIKDGRVIVKDGQLVE